MVLGGDGQCDSPGFNAKNLCYFMMEAESNYILDIEVLDKRHVGLISTNMEKEAVRRSLNRLTTEIKVAELVTDASTSVKALMGIFKYNFFTIVMIQIMFLYVLEHYMHIMVINFLQVCSLPPQIPPPRLYACFSLCFLDKSTFSLLESEYKDITYSLDVWHKSKSIKKCLTKVSMLQYVTHRHIGIAWLMAVR